MKSLGKLFKKDPKKESGRGHGGSTSDKKRLSPEEITSAMEGGSTSIKALLESLEPTDFFGHQDVAALVGGGASPSQVFGPDGRQASYSCFNVSKIAALLQEFWTIGRIFDNTDDSVTITARHAEVSTRFVKITLETDGKDNRVAIALYKDSRSAAMIRYLEDSGSE